MILHKYVSVSNAQFTWHGGVAFCVVHDYDGGNIEIGFTCSHSFYLLLELLFFELLNFIHIHMTFSTPFRSWGLVL